MRGKTAWVVEDDEDIRMLVAAVLRDLGFEVCQAASGRDVDELFRIRLPDLVTLDLGLPDEDGLEICQRIRAVSDAYIIMVTARSDESSVLTGLDLGADDYMGKPFSPRELRARVQALFRRPRHPFGTTMGPTFGTVGRPALRLVEEPIDAGGGLVVHLDRHEAWYDGKPLPLTRTEYDMLAVLAARPGHLFERSSIVSEVWGSGYDGSDHLVDVHVANLRRKLNAASPRKAWIHTVRGAGFRFDPAS